MRVIITMIDIITISNNSSTEDVTDANVYEQ